MSALLALSITNIGGNFSMELRELKIIEKFFLSAQFRAIPLRETGVFLQQTPR
jgi:hypothetical protein